jgi:hypothetical protein
LLLASPLGAFVRNRWIDIQNAPSGFPRILGAVGSRVRTMLDPNCGVPACGCTFVDALDAKISPKTRVVSIYTTDDPIVPVGSCNIRGARNIEVAGTHSGLAFNRDVYRVIAEELARGQLPRSDGIDYSLATMSASMTFHSDPNCDQRARTVNDCGPTYFTS